MVASLSFLIHVCLYLTCLSVSLHIQPTLKKFFIETHGCQMNLADSDIVRSILLTEGYELSDDLEAADLILTNTCAIRENAEDKIWQRLKYFQSIRKKAYLAGSKPKGYPLIGVLGCMAERLKSKLIDEEGVDFVAGPDSYRSLPVLIKSSNTDQTAAQEMLALDETYADIAPVRLAEGNTHAFVTITRGCDNHCAFCIVPYTRGRERSRPVNTILSEICQLREEGFNEVVLLGQNVNSYWDVNSPSEAKYHDYQFEVADGFRTRKNIVKVTKEAEEHDGGVRFGELLARVAEIDPELRVRFQSPHPKDFGDELLRLIAATPNICNSLHIPAQHGSTAVLERMKRGYSREAFVSLVSRARHIIGRDVDSALGLSTDMIAGFCGETHEDHLDNLSLLKEIGFDQAFTYAYSKREQTYAGLFYEDSVPESVKSARLSELIDTFQTNAAERNNRIELGRLHVVLVEGNGKKSRVDEVTWTGRTDTNKRVVFLDASVVSGLLSREEAAVFASIPVRRDLDAPERRMTVATSIEAAMTMSGRARVSVKKGDYVVVKIVSNKGHTLRGIPVATTSLMDAHRLNLDMLQTM